MAEYREQVLLMSLTEAKQAEARTIAEIESIGRRLLDARERLDWIVRRISDLKQSGDAAD